MIAESSIAWDSLEKLVMAEAKKRKLREALGISTTLASEIGFPLSTDSALAIVSIWLSISSAIALRSLALSEAGVLAHSLKAPCAASMAASRSSLSESGTSA